MRTLIGIVLGGCLAAISQGVGAQENVGTAEESLKIAKAPPAIRGWVKRATGPDCRASALGALRAVGRIENTVVEDHYVWGAAQGASIVINCLPNRDGTFVAGLAVAAEQADRAQSLLRTLERNLGSAAPVSQAWRQGNPRRPAVWVRRFTLDRATLGNCSSVAQQLLSSPEQRPVGSFASVTHGMRRSSGVASSALITCIANGQWLTVWLATTSWNSGDAKKVHDRLDQELRQRLEPKR